MTKRLTQRKRVIRKVELSLHEVVPPAPFASQNHRPWPNFHDLTSGRSIGLITTKPQPVIRPLRRLEIHRRQAGKQSVLIACNAR